VCQRRIDEIRSAVIGTGFIARVHIEALRRLGVQLAGVLSRDPGRAKDFAPNARAFSNLGELCDDESIEVVHVTSPNHLHAGQVLALLKARKHVVCEKPLAVNAAQGRELAEEARRAGVVNAVCFNVRYYPVVKEAHQLVASGEIGAPRLITGHYFQDWLLWETDWNWRADSAKGGRLRAASDIGSHWLDLASYLGGVRVEAVLADLYTFVPVRHRPAAAEETFSIAGAGLGQREATQATNEDAASLLLRFSGGARGCLVVSQISPGHKNDPQIEIAGSKASLAWDGRRPELLWVGHRARRNEELVRDPALMSEAAREVSLYPGGHAEGFGDTFRALFADVYADVVAGSPSIQPAYPTFTDGLRGLLVEEAILSSHATGTWQALEMELT
jgi:predicted dehydrogenase